MFYKNSFKINNDGADYWYYQIGVNVIPFDTQKRSPVINYYGKYHNEPIPIEIYERWKREGKFDKGIAIILGEVHRGKNKGRYLIGIDIDKEIGLREFLTRNSKHAKLVNFAEKTIVEQHKDQLHKAHIYFYSPVPFPQKSQDSILGIEVKGRGEHGIMFVSPSMHKNGFNYEIIGNAKEPLFLCSSQAIQLIRHIDNICIKYGLKYLEKEKNRILTELLKKIIKTLKFEPELQYSIHEGQRHITMLSFADSLLINHKNKKSKEELKNFFFLVNDNICLPPLPENELNNIWKSAENFVENLDIHEQTNRILPEKQSLIENATEHILSKYRFLTIEESKEILFYNDNGVYVQGGEILIEKEVESIFGYKLRSADIGEIKGHIMRKTYVKRENFDSNPNIVNLKMACTIFEKVN